MNRLIISYIALCPSILRGLVLRQEQGGEKFSYWVEQTMEP